MQKIISVEKNSAAEKHGIKEGFSIISVNGETVNDIIDYEFLTTEERLEIELLDKQSSRITVLVKKEIYEPLGLNFENGLMSEVKSCGNKCIFCFIDQMPKGQRDSLYVKDDDWRMSFIMGNYITLTNISDSEFDRIIRRRVNQLYISVHATDPEIRTAMMGSKKAGNIMERLTALKEANTLIHCQIVLCPEINDGNILDKTLDDLFSLYPSVRSVALVPVGLTSHREGLYPLKEYTGDESAEIITQAHKRQEEFRKKTGEGFVYLADEFYIKAGAQLPEYEEYDDFPQTENGVGLLRKFENEFLNALETQRPLTNKIRLVSVTGKAPYQFLDRLFLKLRDYGIEIEVNAIENEYFGAGVTVSGLVCGSDIIKQMRGKNIGEYLLLPDNMLKARENIFLDGITVEKLENELACKAIKLSHCDGEQFINELFGILRGEK